MIYEPSDDSYLLKESLDFFLKDKDKKIKILDMGTGSGILAFTCKNLGFKNLLTSDINQESVTLLKKQGFKSIKSDLFEKINKNFDLIIFNPPYLPFDKNEPETSRVITTAGKKGNELIINFLNQGKNHLNKDGVILLLISSLSKPNKIKSKIKKIGLKYELLNSKKLFFEELFVYKIF